MDVARLIVRVGANITELDRGLSEASRRVREFAGQRVDMGELGRSLQRLGKGAREAGKRLTLGVTTPLMGLGAAAVKSRPSTPRSVSWPVGPRAGLVQHIHDGAPSLTAAKGASP